MKTVRGYAALKDEYRTFKLAAGDHRGIDAYAHAEKIGFDARRVTFDKMNNRFGRELSGSVYETGTWFYTLAELLADLRSSDFESYQIDFQVREWRNRWKTDAKETRFDPIKFVKQ